MWHTSHRTQGGEDMSTAVAVKERPILMHARSVRGILDLRKTQTRRPVKHPMYRSPKAIRHIGGLLWKITRGVLNSEIKCPYGQPGDRLYVRETWASDGARVAYKADGSCGAWFGDGAGGRSFLKHGIVGEDYGSPPGDRWRPSIHMPKKLYRILLEVTEVRVERVQEISTDDCFAEGLWPSANQDPTDMADDILEQWERLWDETNAHRPEFSWSNNPWCWCISFRRIEQ